MNNPESGDRDELDGEASHYVVIDGENTVCTMVVFSPGVDDYKFNSKEKAQDAKEAAEQNPMVPNPVTIEEKLEVDEGNSE